HVTRPTTSPSPPLRFSALCYRPTRHLHSFPTRRSSDLATHAVDQKVDNLATSMKAELATKASADDLTKLNGDVNGVKGDLDATRSEEHTSELQSRSDLVCRLLLEKKKADGVPQG